MAIFGLCFRRRNMDLWQEMAGFDERVGLSLAGLLRPVVRSSGLVPGYCPVCCYSISLIDDVSFAVMPKLQWARFSA
jgi:hypothetical protein